MEEIHTVIRESWVQRWSSQVLEHASGGVLARISLVREPLSTEVSGPVIQPDPDRALAPPPLCISRLGGVLFVRIFEVESSLWE